MRRRQYRWLTLVLTLAVGSTGAIWAYRARSLPKRFSEVDPGRLYRSAQPSMSQLERLVRDYGIKTLVIARSEDRPEVAEEIEFGRRNGLNVVQLPIRSALPIPDEQVAEFWRVVDDPRNQPVLVHCAAGRHRTGLLCARYRIERQSWSPERARDEMISFWDGGGRHSTSEVVILNQFDRYLQARGSVGTSPTPASGG